MKLGSTQTKSKTGHFPLSKNHKWQQNTLAYTRIFVNMFELILNEKRINC